jgi:transposase-like protein
VQIEVPRDRDASFDPVIVRKRQRRLDGIDEIVLSLTARGLTIGEIAAHFDASDLVGGFPAVRSLRRRSVRWAP